MLKQMSSNFLVMPKVLYFMKLNTINRIKIVSTSFPFPFYDSTQISFENIKYVYFKYRYHYQSRKALKTM